MGTSPGQTLTLHLQSLSGQGYHIEVRDGDNINGTLLTSATQGDRGQAVSPAVATGNVLWIRYRYNGGRTGAIIKLVVTDSAGKKFLDNIVVFGNPHGNLFKC